MKVKNGFSISWAHTNPKLDVLLVEANITPLQASSMKKNELANVLGIPMLPLPTQTECIICDEDGVVIMAAEVIKHVDDPYSKDKARKFSLKKALSNLFPEYEDKAVRRLFWETYLHRGPSKQEKTFLKLLKKFEAKAPVIA